MSSLLGYRRVSDLNTLSNIYWLNVSKFQSSNTKLLEVVLEIKSNTKSTQSGKINITQAKTSHLDQWQNSTLLLYFIYSICVAFYCLYYMQHFFSESLVFSVTHVERYSWFSSDTFFVAHQMAPFVYVPRAWSRKPELPKKSDTDFRICQDS